jgi:hypothetical protein
MSSRKADAPLSVEIPTPDADRPAWGKVGVITAIGFLIGVAWPRVAGVRVGPSLPSDALSAASASAALSAVSAPALALPAGPASTAAPAAPPPAVAPPPATASVAVGHGAVVSCKSSSGDLLRGADCGALPGLDAIVMPRLRKLADCPQAAGAFGASGKLHLMVRVDFGRDTIGAEAGKGSTVSALDGLVACAKSALADTHPTGVAHDNQRYGVAYHVGFSADAPSAGTAPQSGGAAPDGDAQVAWDVAIVRDAPRSGKIVAKLDRGTSVRVGAMKEGWFPVKYGEGFASEGWVYRAALGR